MHSCLFSAEKQLLVVVTSDMNLIQFSLSIDGNISQTSKVSLGNPHSVAGNTDSNLKLCLQLLRFLALLFWFQSSNANSCRQHLLVE